MKLSSVTIEGMHSVVKKTYTFDKLNYLHGPNGAGKSTALQAVQLALLGYIPGTNKRSEAIFSHANNHTMAVTAKFEGQNEPDVTIRRIWTGTKQGVTTTLEVTPDKYPIESLIQDLELPIFNFNEFVGLSANKLKEWFVSFLPGNTSDIDWVEYLTAAVQDITLSDSSVYADLIHYISTSKLSGIDAVKDVNAYLKSVMSAKKADLARLQSTIQSLIYHDDCDDVMTVAQMEDELARLRALRDSFVRYTNKQEERNRLKSQLSRISLSADTFADDERYIAANRLFENSSSEIEAKTAQMRDLYMSQGDVEKKIDAAKSECVKLSTLASADGTCPYTKETCESILSKISEYRLLLDNAQTQLEHLEAEHKEYQCQISQVAKYIEDHKSLQHKSHSDMLAIQREYAYVDSLKSQIESMESADSEVPEITDLANLDEMIDTLNSSIVKAMANARYTELSDKLTKEKFIVEQSIEAIKRWDRLTGPNGLQTALMTEPFRDLEDSLYKYIQPLFGPNTSAGFNLSEKANSFSFGIYRDDTYIPFDHLSSGEKCLYTLALMIYITSTRDVPLKLILVDDLLDHLDNDNVDKLFSALYEVPDVQFVLAGVKDYTGANASEIVVEVK